jgi:alkaline phosphatase D
MFLVGSAAVVVAACSGDDAATPSTSGGAGTGSTAPGTEPGAPPSTPVSSAPASTAPSSTSPPIELPGDPFTLGVASGDASDVGVVLWTRLAPDPLQGGGMPDIEVEVTWELSADETFAEIHSTGVTMTGPSYAHSVHAMVEVPDGEWRYRFRVGDYISPVGRVKPAPAPGVAVDSVTFASANCQHYEAGFYTAHRDLAAMKPDFVAFLGDYIYEGGQSVVGENDTVRTHGTDECVTLDEYRNRYALYKSDPDLQAAHATCPWYVIWDDHEVDNNYAGSVPSNDAVAATFAQRQRDAYQAWWEHLPVALPAPIDTMEAEGDYQMYRSMQWGSLLTLALLDGRQYRTDQACGDRTLNLDPPCPETFDEARTMLGDEQEEWLLGVLAGSTATWNVITQQTVFGDVTIGGAVLNFDQWDGYPVERNRIVEALDPADNTIVLTGDIHFAGIGTVRAGGRGTGTPVAVELVATSISSGGLINPAVTEVVKAIPDILDAELDHRGYILHRVTPRQWTAEYRMVESVKVPDSEVFVHATYAVDAGTNTARFAD